MLLIGFKLGMLILLLAPVLAGCVHEFSYVSAKHRSYEVPSAFTPMRITSSSWVDPQDHHTAVYTSNPLTPTAKYAGPLRGALYIRTSNEPDAKSWVVHVRKDYRATFVEAPLTEPIKMGKKKILPSFVLGKHKDYKEMAGIYFRITF